MAMRINTLSRELSQRRVSLHLTCTAHIKTHLDSCGMLGFLYANVGPQPEHMFLNTRTDFGKGTFSYLGQGHSLLP